MKLLPHFSLLLCLVAVMKIGQKSLKGMELKMGILGVGAFPRSHGTASCKAVPRSGTAGFIPCHWICHQIRCRPGQERPVRSGEVMQCHGARSESTSFLHRCHECAKYPAYRGWMRDRLDVGCSIARLKIKGAFSH